MCTKADPGQALKKSLESWELVVILSGLFREAGPDGRLPGESLLEQAGLGAIILPDLCPLPQIIPTKYLSSECPWIVL